MRRLVLDASVLLAAPVGRPEGSPSLLVEAARSGVIEMIACETLFVEFERGLQGRYFRARVMPAESSACSTSRGPVGSRRDAGRLSQEGSHASCGKCSWSSVTRPGVAGDRGGEHVAIVGVVDHCWLDAGDCLLGDLCRVNGSRIAATSELACSSLARLSPLRLRVTSSRSTLTMGCPAPPSPWPPGAGVYAIAATRAEVEMKLGLRNRSLGGRGMRP